MLKSDLELAAMTGVIVLKWRTSKPHTMIIQTYNTQLSERSDSNVITTHQRKPSSASKLRSCRSTPPTTPSSPIRFADAMRSQDKRVKLIELPDEDHGLSHTPTRVQSLEEMTKFLHDNLQKTP